MADLSASLRDKSRIQTKGPDLVRRDRAINLAPIAYLKTDLPLRVRLIQMRHGFGNSEKAMHIVGVGKEAARNLPGGRASLWHQANDLRLALANGAKVAVKDLFKVVYRLAVTAINQRRRKAAHARQAHQILRERAKASRRIDRIGREHWIRSDAFQHAVAGDHRAVGFAHERA